VELGAPGGYGAGDAVWVIVHIVVHTGKLIRLV